MRRTAAVVFITGVVLLLYRKVLRLWWTYDDAWTIHLSIAHPWTTGFTDGYGVHRLYTPLLFATYEGLLATFGFDARWWYAVALALIALASLAVYFALRLYTATSSAIAGALLFAAGVPTTVFATQLMGLHYMQAVTLGALSVLTFVLAARRGSNLLNLASAVLYYAAMLAKEIAIPIPLFLLVLPERTLRARARHLVLHAIALAAYFGFRYAALGTLSGGYGWAITADDLPLVIAMLPWKLLKALAGSTIAAGLVAIALTGIGVFFALRSRADVRVTLVALLCAIAPIVIVSKEMQPRFAIVPWLVLCGAFAAGVSRLGPVARGLVILLAVPAVIVANRQEWTGEFGRSMRMSDEARAYMGLDGASILRTPLIPPAAMGELQWLKEQHFRRAPGTSWFYDDSYLCSTPIDGKKIYEYVAARRQVVDVTARMPDFARRYCSTIRDDAPLRVEFSHEGDVLSWRFGPYEEGKWTVVLAGGVQAFQVPAEDRFHLAGVPGLTLRVRYDAPQGWVTYTPELALDFAKRPELTWQR